MRPVASRLPVLAALALVISLLAPPRALACSFVGPVPPPPPDHTELHWGAAYGVGASVVTAMLVSQLAMGAEMFPDWAAALELTLGIAQTVAGPLLMFAVASEGVDSCSIGSNTADEAAIAMGLLFGTGGWRSAHAIWSRADGPLDEPAALPTVSIGPGGAALHDVGVF